MNQGVHDDSAHFLFRGTDHAERVHDKDVCRDQRRHAGLVIAYNGKSLTPEQRRDERRASSVS